jgi:hypothetical protein
MFDRTRCVTYSHKVRSILKHNHGIWLTGVPLGSDQMKAFLDLCTVYFAMRETPEAAAKCYAETCHDVEGHPEDVSYCRGFMSTECILKLLSDETARRLRKLADPF